MKNLFAELKRRNVFKVGVAYIVVSWVILQFVDIIKEILTFPDWFPQMILVLLIIGLPIALVFSWAYEVTPEGVKKTEEVDQSKSITHGTGQKINKLIIGALVLAVGFIIYDKTMVEETPMVEKARASATSIAVLPFVNMSADPEQEFFSDGMTEEILNVLAKNKGLLVAARTSAFSYKSQPEKDIRTIGQELGVETILEGSVRRAGDDLRITAQLVRVEDGFHLWSETYNRKLENVFAVQEEIAFAISDALQAPLGFSSSQLVENRTTDMAAYDLYLQARQLIRQRGEALERAVILLDEVIAREPDFAPAWAAQSLAYAVIPNYLTQFRGAAINTAEILFAAEKTALKAIDLDPNLAEAHFAMAQALRWRRLWGAAEDEYKRAYQLDPDNIEILEDYSEFLFAVGKFREALTLAEKGYRLEPLSPLAITSYASNLSYNERYDEAEAMFKKALELSPGFTWPKEFLTSQYLGLGEVDKAIESLEPCATCQPNPSFEIMRQVLIDLKNGELEPGEANQIILNRDFSSVTAPGFAFTLRGKDGVLDWLEFYAYGNHGYTFVNWEGASYASDVRKTERFKRLVKYTGLEDYWRLRGWPDFCRPIVNDSGADDFECE